MNKTQLAQFTAKLERLLETNTFTRNDAKYSYNWQKSTSMGLILVDSSFNDTGSQIYSIMCIFEDEKRAAEILKSWSGNTWSGKCNFHATDSETILRQFEIFLSEL